MKRLLCLFLFVSVAEAQVTPIQWGKLSGYDTVRMPGISYGIRSAFLTFPDGSKITTAAITKQRLIDSLNAASPWLTQMTRSWQFDSTIQARQTDFPEIAVPANPVADKIRLFAVADADFTVLETLTDLGIRNRLNQDVFRIARNTTGSPISAGQVVYFNGSTGNKPDFALAEADLEIAMPAIGVTTSTVADNNFGEIMIVGRLTGVKTDYEGWNEGDPLYVSPTTPGGLTDIRPTHPNFTQWIGTVEVVHANAGVILINVQAMLGKEDGTNRNSYTIGDQGTGVKSLIFDGLADGTLSWNSATSNWELTSGYLMLGTDTAATRAYARSLVGSYYERGDTATVLLSKTRAAEIYQTIIPNIADTSKYIENEQPTASLGALTITNALTITGGLVYTFIDDQLIRQPTQDTSSTSTTLFIKSLYIGNGGKLTTRSAPNPIDPVPFEADGTNNGWYNTFIGIDAGLSNASGNGNVFIGSLAGRDNTIGVQNVFAGWQAGFHNTSGYHNSFYGAGAGEQNTTGHHNSYFGTDAALYAVDGIQNAAFGTAAGLFLTSGSNNTLLGCYAGDGVTTGSSNVYAGFYSGDSNGTASNNVGIGALSLQSNRGDGNSAIGYGVMLYNTSGASNVAFGKDALRANTTGSNNTAIGFEALTASVASANVAVGYRSFYKLKGTNSFNTGVGYLAGGNDTTGTGNTFVGCNAGLGVASGSSNIAMGYNALQATTTGSFNAAIGQSALNGNTTGSNNIAIGHQSMFYHAGNYSNNVALGYRAGLNDTSGTNNTYIGYLTNATGGPWTNSTALGNGATITASNQMVFGNTSITSNIFKGYVQAPTLRPAYDAANYISLTSTSTGELYISPTGKGVFIGGTTTATAKLHLAAGTAAASTAPLKFTAGTPLTTPEPYVVEPSADGNYLLFTRGSGVRDTLKTGGASATRLDSAGGWYRTGLIKTDVAGVQVMIRGTAGDTTSTSLLHVGGTMDVTSTAEFLATKTYFGTASSITGQVVLRHASNASTTIIKPSDGDGAITLTTPNLTGTIAISDPGATQTFGANNVWAGTAFTLTQTTGLQDSLTAKYNRSEADANFYARADTAAVLASKSFVSNQYTTRPVFVADTLYKAAQLVVLRDSIAVKPTRTELTTLLAAKQNTISNLADTSKYVEGLDSLKAAGYATRTMLQADSLYRRAQELLRILYSDTTSTVANQWRLGYKIGVLGYSVGDTSAFTTTATRKAIYVSGARENQVWAVGPRIPANTTLPVAGDWVTICPKWDSVIVKRPAGTTSGLKFNYWRVR